MEEVTLGANRKGEAAADLGQGQSKQRPRVPEGTRMPQSNGGDLAASWSAKSKALKQKMPQGARQQSNNDSS